MTERELIEEAAIAIFNGLATKPSVTWEANATETTRERYRAIARKVLQSRIAEVDKAWAAMRWVYENGMQPDHSRPQWVSDAFNDAFGPTRAALPAGMADSAYDRMKDDMADASDRLRMRAKEGE